MIDVTKGNNALALIIQASEVNINIPVLVNDKVSSSTEGVNDHHCTEVFRQRNASIIFVREYFNPVPARFVLLFTGGDNQGYKK